MNKTIYPVTEFGKENGIISDAWSQENFYSETWDSFMVLFLFATCDFAINRAWSTDKVRTSK